MTDAIVSYEVTNQSPFDSIRRYDDQGNEFWYARELMPILDLNYLCPEIPDWQKEKFSLKVFCEKLNAQDMGFILLELSSFFSSLHHAGYAKDAFYLHSLAFNTYRGQSATSLFMTVLSAITQNYNGLNMESRFYDYISIKWRQMFPWATTIKSQVSIKKAGIVDFVLDESIPVEVKKEKIGRSDINQIIRYTKAMDSKKGIIVAPSCNIAIPASIQFIPLTIEQINSELMSSHIHVKHKIESRLASIGE